LKNNILYDIITISLEKLKDFTMFQMKDTII